MSSPAPVGLGAPIELAQFSATGDEELEEATALEQSPLVDRRSSSGDAFRQASSGKLPVEIAVEDKYADTSSTTPQMILGVLLVSLANMLNQADRSIMPVAVIPMAKDFGWDMMEKGMVLSSFAVGYLPVQVLAGLAATRMPPGTLLLNAVLAWSLTTLLTPMAARAGVRILMTCRVCMGIAEGFCLPCIFQLLTTTFSVPAEMRSRATAFMIACGGLGQVLALLVCPQISSWDHMFAIFGGAGILWCACFAPFLLMVLPKQGETVTSPTSGSAGDATQEPVSSWVVCVRLVRCPALYAICAAHFSQNWTNYTLATWLPTYLQESLGMPLTGLSITALPFLITAVAGLSVGYVADAVVGRHMVDLLTVRHIATVVGLVGPAFCHILFMTARSPNFAVMIVSLSYLAGATTSSGYMANHGDITTRHAGLTFGVANTVATIPGVLAGPLTAALVESAGGQWWPVFTLAAAIGCAGALIYVTFAQAHRVI